MKQKPRVNYINQIFHQIKIVGWNEKLSMLPESKKHYWDGECLICHQIQPYNIDQLKAKREDGCGKCEQVLLIGQKFNYLTVKEFLGRFPDYSGSRTTRNLFLCQCDCGNYIEVNEHKLKTGNTKSCGCFSIKNSLKQLEKIHQTQCQDLTGMKKGLLTIERLATQEESLNRPAGIRYWFARCDCGNSHIVGTSDFLLGKVQSCGCLLSKGEEKIKKILTQNNINFISQYTFDDLISQYNRKYKFDFAIFNNSQLQYLIEYDGVQHFDPNKQFTMDDYEKIITRDKNKNDFCLKNKIPLIRIPYTKLNTLTINDLLLETTQYLLKGSD